MCPSSSTQRPPHTNRNHKWYCEEVRKSYKDRLALKWKLEGQVMTNYKGLVHHLSKNKLIA